MPWARGAAISARRWRKGRLWRPLEALQRCGLGGARVARRSQKVVCFAFLPAAVPSQFARPRDALSWPLRLNRSLEARWTRR